MPRITSDAPVTHATVPTHPALRRGTDALTRLYSRPGFLLRRAGQIAAAVFENECRPLGLTPAQYGTLTVLQACPGLDQATLARALGYDKVTMLRILRGLESRGMVARDFAAGQRRRLMLEITPDGAALLRSAARNAERAGRRLLAPLSATEQAQLLGLLQKLTASLEGEARAGWSAPDQVPAPVRRPASSGRGAGAKQRR